jgi:hypothetical protein
MSVHLSIFNESYLLAGNGNMMSSFISFLRGEAAGSSEKNHGCCKYQAHYKSRKNWQIFHNFPLVWPINPF